MGGLEGVGEGGLDEGVYDDVDEYQNEHEDDFDGDRL